MPCGTPRPSTTPHSPPPPKPDPLPYNTNAPAPTDVSRLPGRGHFGVRALKTPSGAYTRTNKNPNLFPYKNRFGFFLFGGPGGIRTLDLSDANRTLSQLSYRPICKAGRPILSMTNVLRLTYYTAFWRNCQADFSGFSVQAGLSFPGDAKGRPKQSRRTSRHWHGGSVLWMHIGEYQGESLLTGSVEAPLCRKRRSKSSMGHCISMGARGHCSTMRIRAVPPSI